MSGKQDFPNPYHQLLKNLNRQGADYVLVGASAINYYAPTAMIVLFTADYDIFIRPSPENLWKCVTAAHKSEFSTAYKTAAGRIQVLNKLSVRQCEKLTRQKIVILAEGHYRTTVEFLQEISGFEFDRMLERAVWMEDKKLKVRFPVGHIEDLLESKSLAGREKDRQFLAKYKTLFQIGKKRPM